MSDEIIGATESRDALSERISEELERDARRYTPDFELE